MMYPLDMLPFFCQTEQMGTKTNRWERSCIEFLPILSQSKNVLKGESSSYFLKL